MPQHSLSLTGGIKTVIYTPVVNFEFVVNSKHLLLENINPQKY